MDPERAKDVLSWNPPKDVSEMWSLTNESTGEECKVCVVRKMSN